MFTGLITAVGSLRAITPAGSGHDARLTIAAPWSDTAAIPLGASIACSGCCLTAIAVAPDHFNVQVSEETLRATTLREWRVGRLINLERSLRLGDELGGHIVSGHVDGIGNAEHQEPEHGSVRWTFRVPHALARFIAQKGSVAVDGVSLTVNAVAGDTFSVNIIPHTASHTSFAALTPGAHVNIEIDMLARYVARLTETAA